MPHFALQELEQSIRISMVYRPELRVVTNDKGTLFGTLGQIGILPGHQSGIKPPQGVKRSRTNNAVGAIDVIVGNVPQRTKPKFLEP
jgi:hypothetical protein